MMPLVIRQACKSLRKQRFIFKLGSQLPWKPAREERLTRGFISMTMTRPLVGLTATER